jgi:hypothetical protein
MERARPQSESPSGGSRGFLKGEKDDCRRKKVVPERSPEPGEIRFVLDEEELAEWTKAHEALMAEGGILSGEYWEHMAKLYDIKNRAVGSMLLVSQDEGAAFQRHLEQAAAAMWRFERYLARVVAHSALYPRPKLFQWNSEAQEWSR